MTNVQGVCFTHLLKIAVLKSSFQNKSRGTAHNRNQAADLVLRRQSHPQFMSCLSGMRYLKRHMSCYLQYTQLNFINYSEKGQNKFRIFLYKLFSNCSNCVAKIQFLTILQAYTPRTCKYSLGPSNESGWFSLFVSDNGGLISKYATRSQAARMFGMLHQCN